MQTYSARLAGQPIDTDTTEGVLPRRAVLALMAFVLLRSCTHEHGRLPDVDRCPHADELRRGKGWRGDRRDASEGVGPPDQFLVRKARSSFTVGNCAA